MPRAHQYQHSRVFEEASKVTHLRLTTELRQRVAKIERLLKPSPSFALLRTRFLAIIIDITIVFWSNSLVTLLLRSWLLLFLGCGFGPSPSCGSSSLVLLGLEESSQPRISVLGIRALLFALLLLGWLGGNLNFTPVYVWLILNTVVMAIQVSIERRGRSSRVRDGGIDRRSSR